jgi:predicted nucleic acid-binding protein
VNYKYLLDTNVLLRVADTSETSKIAISAIAKILQDGNQCVITSQVIVEFWAVATRPLNVNGLGWTTEEAREKIDLIKSQFILLEDKNDILPTWLKLVTDYNIKGKRSHDIRLLAVMKSHHISHILTFNPKDFIQLSDIIIINPLDIIT